MTFPDNFTIQGMGLTDELGQLLFYARFRKELNIMIPFIIGLMVGGIVGVFAMCLVQINRDERDD